jgi:calcium/calmodulin-dependent protein kinase I
MDKYDPSNQPLNKAESQPLIEKKQPSDYEASGKLKRSNQPLSPEELQSQESIIEEASDKIRDLIAKNLVLLGLTPNICAADMLDQTPPLTARSNVDSDSHTDNEGGAQTSRETSIPDFQSPSVDLPSEFVKLYDLGKLIGVGSTSRVYQITRRNRRPLTISLSNTSLASLHAPSAVNGLLACKVINKKKLTAQLNHQDIEPLLKQLRREVDILRRISHPNIVSYFDFLESKSQIIIITEYLTGGELFEYLASNGPLPEEMAKFLIHDIFHAIAYLHEHSILHRDIKAENCIFYTNPVTNEISLKLIDFGFSINLQASHMTSSFLGTVGYLAPEIVGNKYYDSSVDNWSLGVLLYAMISAKLPFKPQTHFEPPKPENTSDRYHNLGPTDNIPAPFALPLNATTYSGRIQSSAKLYQLKFPDKQWKNVSLECKDLLMQLLQVDPLKRATAKHAMSHPWVRNCFFCFLFVLI